MTYSDPYTGELRDPRVELDKDFIAELAADPAWREIADYALSAIDLELDLADPDIRKRVIKAGRRAHTRELERRTFRAITGGDPQATRHVPLVYYMRTGDQIKIGTTRCLGNRLSNIGAQGVMAVEPGSYDVESSRHEQFAHLRKYGEWFDFGPELADHIVRLREQFSTETGSSVDDWLADLLPRRRTRRAAS